MYFFIFSCVLAIIFGSHGQVSKTKFGIGHLWKSTENIFPFCPMFSGKTRRWWPFSRNIPIPHQRDAAAAGVQSSSWKVFRTFRSSIQQMSSVLDQGPNVYSKRIVGPHSKIAERKTMNQHSLVLITLHWRYVTMFRTSSSASALLLFHSTWGVPLDYGAGDQLVCPTSPVFLPLTL